MIIKGICKGVDQSCICERVFNASASSIKPFRNFRSLKLEIIEWTNFVVLAVLPNPGPMRSARVFFSSSACKTVIAAEASSVFSVVGKG